MAQQERLRTGLVTYQPNLWRWINASLEGSELHALACLTVFGGSSGKAGVAALKVAEGLHGPKDLLCALHALSVVQKVPGEERYSVHPLVRAVGVKLLGDGQDRLTARQHFLVHMLERGRELDSLGQGPESLAPVLRLLDQELANFRAVAKALDWTGSMEVPLSEEHQRLWLIFAAEVDMLASRLAHRGHLAEAALLQRQVLAVYTNAYGSSHVETACLMHTLAQSLCDLDQLDEAEQLHRQALAVQTDVLGAEHAVSVITQHNLAMVLLALGRKDEADEYLRRVLAVRQRALEADAAPQPEALEGVARVLVRLNRSGEATVLERRALQLREQAGQGAITLAHKYNDLAVYLAADGRWVEAVEVHRRALAIFKQVLGTHKSTAGSYLGLGVALEETGQLVEAEQCLQAAVSMCEQVLSHSHALTASMCDRLAGLLRKQGRMQDAEALYARVVAIRAQHPHTELLANSQRSLAEVRCALGAARG